MPQLSLAEVLKVKQVYCQDIRDRAYSVSSLCSGVDKLPIDYKLNAYEILLNILQLVDNSVAVAIAGICALRLDEENIRMQLKEGIWLYAPRIVLRCHLFFHAMSPKIYKEELFVYNQFWTSHEHPLGKRSDQTNLLVVRRFPDIRFVMQQSCDTSRSPYKCVGWLYIQYDTRKIAGREESDNYYSEHFEWREMTYEPRTIFRVVEDAMSLSCGDRVSR